MKGVAIPVSYAAAKRAEGRFWPKVQKTHTCWNWTGCVANDYGAFRLGGRSLRAHRVSYVLATGDETVLNLCHRCDNPRCVNPEHLFPGTQRDNMRDCASKGRIPRGEQRGIWKLTEPQVIEIWTSTQNYSFFARKFGVKPQTVRSIFQRRSWTHVTDRLGQPAPRVFEKPRLKPDSLLARLIALKVGESITVQGKSSNVGAHHRSLRNRGSFAKLTGRPVAPGVFEITRTH